VPEGRYSHAAPVHARPHPAPRLRLPPRRVSRLSRVAPRLRPRSGSRGGLLAGWELFALRHSTPPHPSRRYKVHFTWPQHLSAVPADTLATSTEACPSVTMAFLQARPVLVSERSPVLGPLFPANTPLTPLLLLPQVLRTLVQAHKLLGGKGNILGGLAAHTRRTKVVSLSGGTHRIPDELRRHTLADDLGGEYSTNLDRNRYGSDDSYLFTVVQYNLRALGLCPCLASVEVLDAKKPHLAGLHAKSPSTECTCASRPGGLPLGTGFGDPAPVVAVLPAPPPNSYGNPNATPAGAAGAAAGAAAQAAGVGGRRGSTGGGRNEMPLPAVHSAAAGAARSAMLSSGGGAQAAVLQGGIDMLLEALAVCGHVPPPSPFAPGKAGGQASAAMAAKFAAAAAEAVQAVAASATNREHNNNECVPLSGKQPAAGPLVRGDPFDVSFGAAVATAAGGSAMASVAPSAKPRRLACQLDAAATSNPASAAPAGHAAPASPQAPGVVGGDVSSDGDPAAAADEPANALRGATSPLRAPSRQTSSLVALRRMLSDAIGERDDLQRLVTHLQGTNKGLVCRLDELERQLGAAHAALAAHAHLPADIASGEGSQPASRRGSMAPPPPPPLAPSASAAAGAARGVKRSASDMMGGEVATPAQAWAPGLLSGAAALHAGRSTVGPNGVVQHTSPMTPA
jgi:hypothetical protein